MPSYELAQQALSNRLAQKELYGLRHLLAGSFAGLCGSLTKVPADVIKKRTQAGLYPNVLAALMSVVDEARLQQRNRIPLLSSLGCFYAGWRSAVFYDIPYNSVQFLILENVKRVVSSSRPNRQLNSTENLFVGAVTGMITSIITEPVSSHPGQCFVHVNNPEFIPVKLTSNIVQVGCRQN